jgi:hypothetical protein
VLSDATGNSAKLWLAARFRECNLHFDISHARGLVTCAIARHEVGVDVESDRSISTFPTLLRSGGSAPPVVSARFARQSGLPVLVAEGGGHQSGERDCAALFDPVRIAFHSERNIRSGRDDPAQWQCWDWHPTSIDGQRLSPRIAHGLTICGGDQEIEDVRPPPKARWNRRSCARIPGRRAGKRSVRCWNRASLCGDRTAMAMGCVPGSGVGAVDNWPAAATATSLA